MSFQSKVSTFKDCEIVEPIYIDSDEEPSEESDFDEEASYESSPRPKRTRMETRSRKNKKLLKADTLRKEMEMYVEWKRGLFGTNSGNGVKSYTSNVGDFGVPPESRKSRVRAFGVPPQPRKSSVEPIYIDLDEEPSEESDLDEEASEESSPRPKRTRMETRSRKNKKIFEADTLRKEMEMYVEWKRGLFRTNSGNGVKSYTSNVGAYGVPPKSRKSTVGSFDGNVPRNTTQNSLYGPDGKLPQKLRNLDPHLIEKISNEIMEGDPNVRWDDIAGLNHAKKCVTEMVIWPLLRPDIFKGCRSPGRGLLLFGPPGTGKTMIGKAIAGESKATFFYISASSLTSKWVGEGEKLVRALFGVARCHQPAVIFMDEIDSLLSQRNSHGEHESSRRLKTQLLIEMDGFDSGSEQILLIGATNRPQDLDEAARRRLTKRFYIPLPSAEARSSIVRNVLNKDGLFKLSTEDIYSICKLTEGYSGSDMTNLVKDASMGPIREALKQGAEITKLKNEDMRPVTLQDFMDALQDVRPSVSLNELGKYEEWNNQFGSLK